MPNPRYAVYFAPAASTEVSRMATRWLGRDAQTGETFAECVDEAFPAEEWNTIVGSPRRYGFHATLKPPFPLADGRTLAELAGAVRTLAESARQIVLPPLQLSRLGRFLALTLCEPSPALEDLAARCVVELDPFRRPATAAELDARRPGLTPRQTELLERWAYPYVLDQWKFHLTLTSSIAEPHLAERVWQYLEPRLALALLKPLRVEDLAIFEEPGDGQPFRIVDRIPLPK